MSVGSYSLRVSVIKNCQLRCGYCLPNGFQSNGQPQGLLSVESYKKISACFTALPIEKIRFTGGEPLIRKDLAPIVSIFRRRFPAISLALTTNGLLYERHISQLVDAGLDSITFHIDTLKPDRYHRIMGAGSLKHILNAIDDAVARGMRTKVNCVVQRGLNDDELIDFLEFGRNTRVVVRFIELMNTGSAKEFTAQRFMSGSEILHVIKQNTLISPMERETMSSPSERYFAHELEIAFGLIASDTRPFCGNCDRLRLSADGYLRTCLYEPVGKNLCSHNSDDWDEERTIEKIREKVARKISHHPASNNKRSPFSMSKIGG